MSSWPRRRRPSCDGLEARVQLSVTMPHVYPMDFDGPLPTGAIRGDLARIEGSATGINVHPMLVTGMTFSPANPVIGTSFGANLTVGPANTYNIAGTTWTYTITYGGFTSPPTNISDGGATSAQVNAFFPGSYTIPAVTSYQTINPSDSPPPPTTTTATVTIAPPDTATKGGAINTPTNVNTAAQIVDQLSAEGQPVGLLMNGSAQENIASFTWFTGSRDTGSGGWIPPSPSPQFNLSQGAINDQMALFVPSRPITQAQWDALAVGSTVCTYTQALRIQWTMTASAGPGLPYANQTFTVSLNTLTWTWVKTSATQWQAQ